MKIRHPWLIKAMTLAGGWGLRRWMRTLRYEYQSTGPSVDPNESDMCGRYIYAMWHEYLLLPIFLYPRRDVHVLISRHADGQLIADVCRHLHIPVVCGSTTRGGAEALRGLLRAGRADHLAVTPDGPRGPRQRVKPGLLYLAARTGLPIVPVGFGLERPWRMHSWDRMALPRPWSRAACVTGTPIVVPGHCDKEQLEEYRLRVEATMLATTYAAEVWAETGTRPAAEAAPTGDLDATGLSSTGAA